MLLAREQLSTVWQQFVGGSVFLQDIVLPRRCSRQYNWSKPTHCTHFRRRTHCTAETVDTYRRYNYILFTRCALCSVQLCSVHTVQMCTVQLCTMQLCTMQLCSLQSAVCSCALCSCAAVPCATVHCALCTLCRGDGSLYLDDIPGHSQSQFCHRKYFAQRCPR